MLYNSNEIQQIIPHRYPFLLVDCIESISEDGKTRNLRKTRQGVVISNS